MSDLCNSTSRRLHRLGVTGFRRVFLISSQKEMWSEKGKRWWEEDEGQVENEKEQGVEMYCHGTVSSGMRNDRGKEGN